MSVATLSFLDFLTVIFIYVNVFAVRDVVINLFIEQGKYKNIDKAAPEKLPLLMLHC